MINNEITRIAPKLLPDSIQPLYPVFVSMYVNDDVFVQIK